MRSGLFIWEQSFPEILLSLCSASLLFLPRSPNSALPMPVTHQPHIQIHTLHSWLPAPPATPRRLRRLLRDPDPGAAGLSTRPGLWLPGNHCSCLTHPTNSQLPELERGCCPTGPFCATGQGLKSLLQRKLSFNSCSVHFTIALLG